LTVDDLPDAAENEADDMDGPAPFALAGRAPKIVQACGSIGSHFTPDLKVIKDNNRGTSVLCHYWTELIQ